MVIPTLSLSNVEIHLAHEADPALERANLFAEIANNWVQLDSIFSHYAASSYTSMSSDTLSIKEFLDFCVACSFDKGGLLTEQAIKDTFLTCVPAPKWQHKSSSAAPSSAAKGNKYVTSDESEMTVTDFAQALVLLANIQYPRRSGALCVRFKRFLETYVFPNAFTSVQSKFRSELTLPAVKGVFHKHKGVLGRIYHRYSSLDSSTLVAKNSLNFMNFDEFAQMCMDAKLEFSGLRPDVWKHAFERAQNEQSDDAEVRTCVSVYVVDI